jgi:hypothetical protein
LQEEFIEVLVVADLVGADRGGEAAQHRLVRAEARQRAIEGGRPGLHNAARRHLERLGFGQALRLAERRVEIEKSLVGGVPVEAGPGGLDVALQRRAMLHFLWLPLVFQPARDRRVAAKIVDQVVRVEVRGDLDERGRSHEIKQPLVSAWWPRAERAVGDVLDRPGGSTCFYGVLH